MNDLAIFNDDYFDFDDMDDASEGTTAKRVIANTTALSAIIYEFIHNAHIKKSVVVDVDAMIANGLSKEKAMSDAKKAIKFFRDNKYLAYDVDPSAGKLYYKSLNESGKLFVKGFYDKMDEITPFSVEKAINAKKFGKESSSSKIAFAINTAKCILLCIGMGISGTLIVMILSTIAFAGAYGLMLKYTVDIAGRGEFDNSFIKESTDIFDSDYFENADIALEAKTDTVISISDFNYMPKKDAEKAYKHVVRTMITDGMLDEDPNSDKIQKGNALWYHLTLKSNIVRLVNRVHKCKFDAADEFISEFDRLWNNEQNARKESTERMQQYKHERNMVKYARTGKYYF